MSDRTRTLVDVLGALGVIASLIFVGLEIRQNTAVARVTAFHTFLSEVNTLTDRVVTDDRLAGLIARTAQGEVMADFSPEDQLRLRAHFLSILRVWEGLHRSVGEGILDDSELGLIGAGNIDANPFFMELWPGVRGQFSASFVEFMETRLRL